MKTKAPNHKHALGMIDRGYSVIVGVDEVGRGCLAGPVTAAAVILAPETRVRGARDSKLLSPLQRHHLALTIKRRALAIGLGWASSAEIDEFGLTKAVQLSGLRALKSLGTGYDAVILDGNHNYLRDHCYAEAIIKADQTSLSVACASIVAKVARDRYMSLMHRLYPKYGFNRHKGYGTPEHQQALKYGLTPLHRRLFAPVAKLESAYFETLPTGLFDVD